MAVVSFNMARLSRGRLPLSAHLTAHSLYFARINWISTLVLVVSSTLDGMGAHCISSVSRTASSWPNAQDRSGRFLTGRTGGRAREPLWYFGLSTSTTSSVGNLPPIPTVSRIESNGKAGRALRSLTHFAGASSSPSEMNTIMTRSGALLPGMPFTTACILLKAGAMWVAPCSGLFSCAMSVAASTPPLKVMTQKRVPGSRLVSMMLPTASRTALVKSDMDPDSSRRKQTWVGRGLRSSDWLGWDIVMY